MKNLFKKNTNKTLASEKQKLSLLAKKITKLLPWVMLFSLPWTYQIMMTTFTPDSATIILEKTWYLHMLKYAYRTSAFILFYYMIKAAIVLTGLEKLQKKELKELEEYIALKAPNENELMFTLERQNIL